MTDLGALLPGGGIVGAAVGLVAWLWRSNREDRGEWRQVLTDERVRHEADNEKWEREETHLRGRLADAESVIAGEKDRRWDAERQLAAARAQLAAAEARAAWPPPGVGPGGLPWPPAAGNTGGN